MKKITFKYLAIISTLITYAFHGLQAQCNAPIATAMPSVQTICSGQTTSITLSSNLPGTSFSGTISQDSGSITGASAFTSASIQQVLTNPSNSSTGKVVYKVYPTANGCTGSPIDVIVFVEPVASIWATSAASICSGDSTLIVLNSTVSGVTFSWTASQSGITGAQNGSGNTIHQGLTTTGNITGKALYTISGVDTSSCPISSIIDSIKVKPKPTITASPQTVCSSDTISISVTSNINGALYSWTVTQTGVSGGTAGNDTVIKQTLSTTGSSSGIAKYIITSSYGNCSGNTIVDSLLVNPREDASFHYLLSTYCQAGTNPTPIITGVSGGVFSASPSGLVIDSLTGTINLSTSLLGSYSVKYKTNTTCYGTSSVPITISNPSSFNYSSTSYCKNTSNPSPIFGSGSNAGVFSVNPSGLVFTNVNTGEINIQASAAGTYIVKNTVVASGGCPSSADSTSVNLIPLPTIIATPTSQTICSGTASSIILTADITGTTFTWTVVQTNVTGASFFPNPIISDTLYTTSSDTGIAVYTVSPSYNGCMGTNTTVPITVKPRPIITTSTSQTICSGSNTSVMLSSSPPNATFSWTVNQIGTTGALNGSGDTISQVLITNGNSSGTAIYSITATINGCTNSSVLDTISVKPNPSVSAFPLPQTICTFDTASIHLSSNITGTSFSWTAQQIGVVGTSNGNDTIIKQVLATTGTNAGIAKYLITPTLNGCIGNSILDSVIVNQKDNASFHYSSGSYCQAGTNPAPIITGISGGVFSASPSGLVIDSLSGIINLSVSAVGNYNIVYKTNYLCSNSDTVLLSILTSPLAGFHFSDSVYCSNLTNPTPIFDIGAGAGVFSASPFGLVFNNVNTGTINLLASAVGTYTITNTIAANGGCQAVSDSTYLTIKPTPNIFATPSSQTICSGSSTSISLTGSIQGTLYSWTVTPINVLGSANGIGDSIAQILTTSGNGNVIYSITPTFNGCIGTSVNDTVLVTNVPVVIANPSSQTICYGDTTSITLSSTTIGTTYSWTVSQINVSGALAGTGSNIKQALLAIGSSIGDVVYTIIPTLGSCVGSSISIPVSVKPQIIASTTSTSQSICSGEQCTILLSSNVYGTQFSRTVTAIDAQNYNWGWNNIAVYGIATTSNPGKLIFTIYPHLASCYGNTLIDTVIVNPKDASFIYPSATYCISGADVLPTITGVSGGTFSSNPTGLSIDPSTGNISPSLSAAGIYTVSYTTNNPCPVTSSVDITITSLSSSDFSYSDSVFCLSFNNQNPYPIFTGSSSAGVFSATPSGLVFGNTLSGEIDLWHSVIGSYSITNTIPTSGSCPTVSTTKTVYVDFCYIGGTIFKDVNGNCFKDNEQSLRNVKVSLYDGNNNLVQCLYPFYYYSDYGFLLDSIGTYTVKIDTIASQYEVVCNNPGIDSAVMVIPNNSYFYDIDFPVVCRPQFDLGGYTGNYYGFVFPGLQHLLRLYAGDVGQLYSSSSCSNSVGVSGQVQVTLSGPVTYNGAPAGALVPTVNGNVLTYNIADYSSINVWNDFRINLITNSSAQTGDEICANVSITPTVGDINISNNTYQYCYYVVNSFDPNYKEVNPKIISPNSQDWLTYTIHFQNTGAAPAMNIRLTDTLDANLNFETFELLSFSYDSLQVTLHNNLLTFKFPNIMLPDSASDLQGSQGFVQYRIKPKANLQAGMQLKNTAYIYFDYNAPIITNTAITDVTMTAFVAGGGSSENLLKVYPNPGTGKYNVELPKELNNTEINIKVYSILGEQILNTKSQNNLNQIDLSQQPNGVYILKIIGDKLLFNQRIIKN